MTALAGPLISGGIKAGAGLLASKAFGKRNKGGVSSFRPAGFRGGGLSSSFDPGSGSFKISSSPERQGLVRNLASLFPEQASLISGIRSQLTPGFGALTASRLSELDTRASRAIGNLRDNLQRRRVLGSSFGQDAVQRAELGVAQEADRIRAESFLQELELNRQLIGQEFDLRRNEFQTELSELNLQAEIASGLVGGATSQLGANARFLEALNAREAQRGGAFFGSIAQPIAKAAGSFFGGGGGGIGDFTTITRNAAGSII